MMFDNKGDYAGELSEEDKDVVSIGTLTSTQYDVLSNSGIAGKYFKHLRYENGGSLHKWHEDDPAGVCFYLRSDLLMELTKYVNSRVSMFTKECSEHLLQQLLSLKPYYRSVVIYYLVSENSGKEVKRLTLKDFDWKSSDEGSKFWKSAHQALEIGNPKETNHPAFTQTYTGKYVPDVVRLEASTEELIDSLLKYRISDRDQKREIQMLEERVRLLEGGRHKPLKRRVK